MEKEDVMLLLQLLKTLQEAVNELSTAQIKRNAVRLNKIKKEILQMQKQISSIISK